MKQMKKKLLFHQKKDHKSLITKDCFSISINMEYQKITNLLGSIPYKVPIFITKKWIEVHDQSGETCKTNKQIRFKKSMLRSDLCDDSDAYIVPKDAYDKKLVFKKMHHFLAAFQKLIIHLLIMLKI